MIMIILAQHFKNTHATKGGEEVGSEMESSVVEGFGWCCQDHYLRKIINRFRKKVELRCSAVSVEVSADLKKNLRLESSELPHP